MNELSTGRGGRSIPCTDEDPLAEEDGNEDVEAHGVYRWVPDYSNDPTPPDDGAGEWYRYVCYIEGRPVFPANPAGASWRRFEAVTPENVALLAIDRMLAGIPTQWVRTTARTRPGLTVPSRWSAWTPGSGSTRPRSTR